MKPINIQIEPMGLDHPDVALLLQDHLDQMAGTAPPESRHALDLTGLKHESVHFYSAWVEGELAGCAAIKRIDATHGELKSMKTASAFLRKGIASALLKHMLEQAKMLGLKRVSLETGSMDYFQAARTMYAKQGFRECEPFAQYKLDPNSRFMTRDL